MIRKVAENLDKVRSTRPLVHHITNYVTVNDCANITLQVGALPVMADAAEEVEEMVAIANSLVLNIGTLNPRTVASMLKAGKKANQLGIPVILDPVGVGATSYRTDSTTLILEEVKISILKGNPAEIGILAGLDAEVRGVESGEVAGDLLKAGQRLAARLGNVVVVTGVRDLVLSATRAVTVNNGHPFMGTITGTGCMCASVLGAFGAVVADPFEAAVSSLVCFGIAGQLAAGDGVKGPGSYRTTFLDRMAGLTRDDIIRMASIQDA
ncbi:MAG: hydroxyethylthiazole kinase [Syntrophomonadaceae bacterium]|nr:hydroxyethylthiazole kinase [Syntrophomonadaceae bacterium]